MCLNLTKSLRQTTGNILQNERERFICVHSSLGLPWYALPLFARYESWEYVMEWKEETAWGLLVGWRNTWKSRSLWSRVCTSRSIPPRYADQRSRHHTQASSQRCISGTRSVRRSAINGQGNKVGKAENPNNLYILAKKALTVLSVEPPLDGLQFFFEASYSWPECMIHSALQFVCVYGDNPSDVLKFFHNLLHPQFYAN